MARKMTTELFIKRAVEVHGDKYTYSETVCNNGFDKVTITCPKHGHFTLVAREHVYKKRGCSLCEGKKICDINFFIERARIKHNNKYTYENSVYTSTNVPVTITCPKHGDFTQKPKIHLSGAGCPECGISAKRQPRTITPKEVTDVASFIAKANKIHSNVYSYEHSVYTRSKSKITITCNLHGDFRIPAYRHLLGQGCTICAQSTKNERRSRTKEEFISLSRAVHGDTFEYNFPDGKYMTYDNVEITCRTHGTFVQKLSTHIHNKAGCPSCARESCSKKGTMSTDEFIKRSKEINGDKYDYTKTVYIRSNRKLIITCPKHGDFEQTPDIHFGYNCGCPKCGNSVSKAETEWLNSIGLPDTPSHRQVRIKVGNKHIRVDGYDSTTNTIYEFLGDYWHGNISKYCPTDINEKNQKTYGELFNETIERFTKIQTEGYKIVWIWESEYKKSGV